ncbi:UDP pyrophosphate phosphatase [Marinobacter sp. SS5-14b]|uniref:UDP pyrophosphate phosphatase n=1 Tax=Marinobacter sp. SS5-14b TaxID=3050456 RepID=UPI0026DF21F6|nr:UDP pyrophosphate phosphatase [Marinobacter sp. SS5-14b]
MIGGINPANSSFIPAGNNSPARDRSDVARAPASSPQAPGPEAVRRDLGAPQQPRDDAPVPQPDAAEGRRIEARRAAEDARLERFRADELPLPASRALSAFAGVAAAGQEFENGSVITGIDIIV